MKKYFMLALCAILSIGLITGCGSKKEDKKDNKESETTENNTNETNGVMEGSHQIDTCPNCYFSYNHSTEIFYVDYSEKNKRSNIKELTDNKTYTVTTDYKEITDVADRYGTKTDKWLGYVLDNDGYIIRGFVCATINDKTFCLEGTTDGSKYEENKKILKDVFDDNCKESTYNDEQYFTCGDPYSNYYETISDGTVAIKTNLSICKVQSNGWIECELD